MRDVQICKLRKYIYSSNHENDDDYIITFTIFLCNLIINNPAFLADKSEIVKFKDGQTYLIC